VVALRHGVSIRGHGVGERLDVAPLVRDERLGSWRTVTDPDGNYVQIIERAATPEAHRS
jgi:hypothetical protein